MASTDRGPGHASHDDGTTVSSGKAFPGISGRTQAARHLSDERRLDVLQVTTTADRPDLQGESVTHGQHAGRGQGQSPSDSSPSSTRPARRSAAPTSRSPTTAPTAPNSYIRPPWALPVEREGFSRMPPAPDRATRPSTAGADHGIQADPWPAPGQRSRRAGRLPRPRSRPTPCSTTYTQGSRPERIRRHVPARAPDAGRRPSSRSLLSRRADGRGVTDRRAASRWTVGSAYGPFAFFDYRSARGLGRVGRAATGCPGGSRHLGGARRPSTYQPPPGHRTACPNAGDSVTLSSPGKDRRHIRIVGQQVVR
jgi:hypothetical protein